MKFFDHLRRSIPAALVAILVCAAIAFGSSQLPHSTLHAQQIGRGGVPSAATPIPGTGGSYTGPITAPNVLPVLDASNCGTSSKPSWCSGSEIGAWVNSAVAQLAGNPGTIEVDDRQSSWSQSTQITIPLNVKLRCKAAPLVWQLTSGVALAIAGPSPTSTASSLGSVEGCTLISTGAVSSTTNTGIYVGADPNGVVTPSTSYGDQVMIFNSKIAGFNTAIANGSNAWGLDLKKVQIGGNYNGIHAVGDGVGGVNNSGAPMTLDGGSVVFNNSNYGMWFDGFNSQWHISDAEFSYNGTNIYGEPQADFKSIHLEAANQCPINIDSLVHMNFYGGDWYLNGPAGSYSGFICTSSPNPNSIINLSGINAGSHSGDTVTNLIHTGGTSPIAVCPADQSVMYNYVAQSPAWLVDSGKYTCGNVGYTTAAGFTVSGNMLAGGFANGADNAMNLAVQPGATASQPGCFQFNDYNGANKYSLCKTNSNTFAITDQVTGLGVLKFNPGGQTYLNSAGTGQAVNINMSTNSGTGGFIVGTGGSTPAAALTITIGGSMVATNYNIAGTTGVATFKGVTSSGAVTAPAFLRQTVTAGPYLNYFTDFIDTQWQPVAIGSATGQTCSIQPGNGLSQNVVGALILTSGTGGSGTGVGCYPNGNVLDFVTPNSSLGWTEESKVYVPVLPGTTAATYEIGISAGITTVPWTTGYGFYLSSANAVQNDWYCMYGSTYTDSSIAATTTAWTRLSMVSDGSNMHWYINGTQVCGTGTALSGMPSNTTHIGEAAVVAGTTTSVNFQVDYYTMQRNIGR
jgi:hypothetical protein